ALSYTTLPRQRPPTFTLFPYTTLFRSGPLYPQRQSVPGAVRPADRRRLEGRRDGRGAGLVPEPASELPRGHADRRRGDEDPRHRSEEHTSELQSRFDLVCRLLLEKKKK